MRRPATSIRLPIRRLARTLLVTRLLYGRADGRDEIKAGVRTSATYTIEQCVQDWFASIERDPHTMETMMGQARNWIYPRIGAKKLRNFSATDADRFFRQIAPFLSKRSWS